VFLQRLFSSFASGWPGLGLLLQRLLTAAVLFHLAIGVHGEAQAFLSAAPQIIGAVAGIFLLAGLWTPAVGILVAVVEVWIACFCTGGQLIPITLAILGLTLAMIGPGALSIDARLFGRKHIETPTR
jgi:putative oxidoreductase